VSVTGVSEAEKERRFGFILTRQWVEKNDGLDLVFWLASPQGPVRNENSPKQASGYQREMHSDETPRFLKLFPL
jgi:hypothetical protein